MINSFPFRFILRNVSCGSDYYQTLYRQTRDECSLAWVMLGTGIRIAQSFGLHHMIGYTQETSVYRAEIKRRIWWSLCELDQWTSCMLGRPPAIGHTNYGVPLPSPVSDILHLPS